MNRVVVIFDCVQRANSSSNPVDFTRYPKSGPGAVPFPYNESGGGYI
jgi:hypothetical protein